jgi:hypothetical protein
MGEEIELKGSWLLSGLEIVIILSDLEQMPSFSFCNSCRLQKAYFLNSKLVSNKLIIPLTMLKMMYGS